METGLTHLMDLMPQVHNSIAHMIINTSITSSRWIISQQGLPSATLCPILK